MHTTLVVEECRGFGVHNRVGRDTIILKKEGDPGDDYRQNSTDEDENMTYRRLATSGSALRSGIMFVGVCLVGKRNRHQGKGRVAVPSNQNTKTTLDLTVMHKDPRHIPCNTARSRHGTM